jgi:hypothetical protein
MDALLAADDGLKWFNRLYLMVTQQVDLNSPGGAWASPLWLTRLDVVFASLYFSAVAGFLSGRSLPSAWSVLFEARYRTGIDRIQFAVAGMNAHINHDLALALLTTDAELNVVPASDGPEFTDYQSVNRLLNTVMPSALTTLAPIRWVFSHRTPAKSDACSPSGTSAKPASLLGTSPTSCAVSPGSLVTLPSVRRTDSPALLAAPYSPPPESSPRGLDFLPPNIQSGMAELNRSTAESQLLVQLIAQVQAQGFEPRCHNAFSRLGP